MTGCLEGLTVAVLGGDARERYAARYLQAKGATVRLFGTGEPAGSGDDLRQCASLEEALHAQVVLGPVKGIDDDGTVYQQSGDDLQLTPGLLADQQEVELLIAGKISPAWKQQVASLPLAVESLLDQDSFVLANAVPTAEAAISLAVDQSQDTLWQSPSLVLGYGRCGQAIAQRLHTWGSQVTVVERSAAGRAAAKTTAIRAIDFSDLYSVLQDTKFVFNTVPAQVFEAEHLKQLPPSAVIIDIASAPGGVDHQAAAELNLRCELALGLPGRTAPATAGRLVAEETVKLVKDR